MPTETFEGMYSFVPHAPGSEADCLLGYLALVSVRLRGVRNGFDVNIDIFCTRYSGSDVLSFQPNDAPALQAQSRMH